ncbi:hypothetical protein CHS0354_041306 [Potamilus streckersoni]|uniref:Uncharacterized protein n=1 Tax=Potamilus streckersoni TaxID=2493646 RepID=A0AAE0VV12_9BIVA|nr:hypothetical protein CHS0354_041306 [Potamilus streckersoni]
MMKLFGKVYQPQNLVSRDMIVSFTYPTKFPPPPQHLGIQAYTPIKHTGIESKAKDSPGHNPSFPTIPLPQHGQAQRQGIVQAVPGLLSNN